VNPNSHGGATGRDWPVTRRAIEGVLGPIEERLTTRRGEAVDLTQAALRDGFDLVVSVGGDGTNNEVVNGFFEDDRPVNPDAVFATVPQGTGGDFRKTAGIPKAVSEAVKLLAGSQTRTIDVGRMTMVDMEGRPAVRYFLNITSFGIGGVADDYVNRSKKTLGSFLSYFIASFRALVTYRNQPVRLVIDGKDWGERTVFNVVVANGRYFGSGMFVAPYAELDDGLFDVVVFGDLSVYDKFVRLTSIYKGEHLKMRNVVWMRARRVEATSSSAVLHDVDGENLGRLPSVFEVIPGALKLKVAP
jgi:YegS/Rv2252/BmrU family lipid kinase